MSLKLSQTTDALCLHDQLCYANDMELQVVLDQQKILLECHSVALEKISVLQERVLAGVEGMCFSNLNCSQVAGAAEQNQLCTVSASAITAVAIPEAAIIRDSKSPMAGDWQDLS